MQRIPYKTLITFPQQNNLPICIDCSLLLLCIKLHACTPQNDVYQKVKTARPADKLGHNWVTIIP